MYTIADPVMNRRTFLQGATLCLAGSFDFEDDQPLARLGLLTDIHYADTPERGTRFYRDSIEKTAQAVHQFNNEKCDALIHLGDLIDALPEPTAESELRFLKRIDRELKAFRGPRHYVLGNHCIYSLTKPAYLDAVQKRKSWYSFDLNGVHCIVLDACFRKDGTPYGSQNADWKDTDIPADQREWLAVDLAGTQNPVVIFVHQVLHAEPGNPHGVHSAPEVRKIIERSGKVAVALQGHAHVNELNRRQGIPYITLQATVERPGAANAAYSVLEVYKGGGVRLSGFGQHRENPATKLERDRRPEDPASLTSP